MNKKQKKILIVGGALFILVVFVTRSYNLILSDQLMYMDIQLMVSNANTTVTNAFKTLESMTYSYYKKSLFTLWGVIIVMTAFNFWLAREE